MRYPILALHIAAVIVVTVTPSTSRADPACRVSALDCVATTRFSATANTASDMIFVAALALPVAFELGRGFDDESPRRGIAYGGALGVTALTAAVFKIAFQRDRPYTYNTDPAVVAYTAHARGRDHSFFSGHTSLVYAALTSGAVLYNPTSHSERARLGLWVSAGALGGATGVLRIRAGQHFPSDVLTGALVGTVFGAGITYALAPERDLRASDLGALLAGTAAGSLAAGLAPIPSDVALPLGVRRVALAPSWVRGHASVALVGELR